MGPEYNCLHHHRSQFSDEDDEICLGSIQPGIQTIQQKGKVVWQTYRGLHTGGLQSSYSIP